MKKLLILSALLLGGSALWAQSAELSFDFKRITGSGSNQFAVWVEDEASAYIKTLYATRFTATGGWERRPASIPIWVKKSALANMSKTNVDALTGATPQTGKLTYRWDFTDGKGAKVKPGKYKIILEATLRNTTEVVYSAEIQSDVASNNAVEPKYSGKSVVEREMIGGVRIKVIKGA
jgi:hypothetical protein